MNWKLITSNNEEQGEWPTREAAILEGMQDPTGAAFELVNCVTYTPYTVSDETGDYTVVYDEDRNFTYVSDGNNIFNKVGKLADSHVSTFFQRENDRAMAEQYLPEGEELA